MLKQVWEWFKKPGARWGLAVGVFGAAFVVTSFVGMVKYTNTLEFCVSCHSMQFPYQEYKKSPHFINSVGVQAECPDCHVPHEFPDVLIAKVFAVKDVTHEILGTVNTQEKYEEHRLAMAKAVWAKMEATESRECRNCHDFKNMDFDQQGRRARRKHEEAMNEGKHCINCHKGVVHELPKGYEG